MSEDKRQNEIIRIQKKRNNFVMLDKGFLEDNRLSYKAKGLLAYLLSKPDEWKVIVKDLINHSTDGKKAVYSGLKELKECGYYKKVPIRDEKGQRIIRWESVVYETPVECSIAPVADSLLIQKGEVEKSTENSTSSLLPPFVYIDNVDIQNGQRSNNNNNNIKYNNIESNPILSDRFEEKPEEKPEEKEKTDWIGLDENPKQSVLTKKNKESSKDAIPSNSDKQSEPSSTESDYNTLLEKIKENINYDYIIFDNPDDQALVDGIVQVIVSTIMTNFKNGYVSMGGEDIPAELVKSVFFKLTKDDIEYFISNFRMETKDIIKLPAYIRASLYRNYKIDAMHWTNRANVNMPYLANKRHIEQP